MWKSERKKRRNGRGERRERSWQSEFLHVSYHLRVGKVLPSLCAFFFPLELAGIRETGRGREEH